MPATDDHLRSIHERDTREGCGHFARQLAAMRGITRVRIVPNPPRLRDQFTLAVDVVGADDVALDEVVHYVEQRLGRMNWPLLVTDDRDDPQAGDTGRVRFTFCPPV